MAYKNKTLSARNKIRIFLLIIIVIAVLGGFLDYPKLYDKGIDLLNNKLGLKVPHYWNLSFKLGLDLQGGTQLVYQADVSQVAGKDQSDAVQGVRDVIERRVNAFGVSEPLVQTTKEGSNYRVIVELAGVKDVNQAIKMIGETPLLEFKEQATGPQTLTADQKKEMDSYNKDAKAKADKILTQALDSPAKFADLAKANSEDDATKDAGGDLGYVKDGYAHSEFLVAMKAIGSGEVYSKTVENAEGYNILKKGEIKNDLEIKASHILICYKGAPQCTQNISKEDALKKIQGLKNEATSDNFAKLAKENSNDSSASSGGDLGYFGKGTMVKPFEDAAFALKTNQISDVVETEFGYHLIMKTGEREVSTTQIFRILIKKKTEADYISQDQFKNTGLSGKDLKHAQVNIDPNTNEPEVSLEFTDTGKTLFADITGRNVGKVVAIYLDGQPISTPTVNEKITSGSARITGKFTLEEAKTLARRLNAGALPVPINLVSQQTVGASLGQEFISKSLNAAFLAFLLITLFMILYYRLPGLLSIIALVIYVIINLAIYKLIPVTMTLSGIAGFVLSVGMAVDANVLIFERLKEELSWGKPLGSASEEGFRRAWPSIRDGNLTTLISCFFLYWFGTSMIKGFALTLFIGVVFSMLSAITITRTFMNMIIGWAPVQNSKWLFLYKKSKEENT